MKEGSFYLVDGKPLRLVKKTLKKYTFVNMNGIPTSINPHKKAIEFLIDDSDKGALAKIQGRVSEMLKEKE